MLSLLRRQRLKVALHEGPQLGLSNSSSRTSVKFLTKHHTRSFQSTARPKGQAGLAQTPNPGDVMGIPYGVIRPTKMQAEFPRSPHRHSQLPSRKPVMNGILEETQDTIIVETKATSVPVYFRGSKFERVPYWTKISRWQNATEDQFLSYRWGVSYCLYLRYVYANEANKTANDIQGKAKLFKFLNEVVHEKLPPSELCSHIETREDFVTDVMEGIDLAPMSIRIPPHIMSSIDWSNPLNDPLRRQFIPMKSTFQPDHPKLTLDSLHETEDSPCEGLVHRYTDKCLFLGRPFHSERRWSLGIDLSFQLALIVPSIADTVLGPTQ